MLAKVVVVILNYNGADDTIACLETLAPQRHAGLEVLVVDNGSAKPVREAMDPQFADIPVLRLEDNHGWAGGNNAGIAWGLERGADLLCLLNNDTLVPAGGIDKLAAAARALGPCLLHPAIDYANPEEGIQLDPRSSPDTVPVAGHDGVFEIDYAYGACLMVPADVFRRIGTFDERFFLQLEETDFYLRARKIGLRSLCLPEVRIIHAESRSFGGRSTPLKLYYTARNSLLLTEKHDRTLAGYGRTLRRLLWSMARARTRRGLTARSTGSTALWLCLSRDRFAVHARNGLRDYLLRRFGPYRSAGHKNAPSRQ